MIRNLKVLGLALVAALSMSAVSASVASAESTFTASSYPATIVGINQSQYEFSFNGVSIVCGQVEYHAELTEASTELDITPTFENCAANGVVQVITTLNGCYYKSTALNEFEKDRLFGAQDLVCPPGKSMETHGSTCKITHYPQTNIETVLFEDHTGGPFKRFTILNETKGSTQYRIHKGALCPLEEGEFSNGSSSGAMTITAENEAEEQIDVYVG